MYSMYNTYFSTYILCSALVSLSSFIWQWFSESKKLNFIPTYIYILMFGVYEVIKFQEGNM